ncbi:MAG: hypothetical protein JSS22_04605 [Proteobacteria bacterium]|nr:hypothetical protein [Pseudomonadota bacterium]
MGKIITAVAFLALIGASAALAQSGTNAGSGSMAAPSPRTTNSAPIGHRQPRASDIPSENSKAGNPGNIDPEEAALDRKIKSICRGC